MNFKTAIETASRLAYEQNAAHLVGRVNGDWVIVHWEDTGRMAQQAEPAFAVYGHGLDANDTLYVAAEADLELDQDWQAGTTSFLLDGFRVIVDGPTVEIVNA